MPAVKKRECYLPMPCFVHVDLLVIYTSESFDGASLAGTEHVSQVKKRVLQATPASLWRRSGLVGAWLVPQGTKDTTEYDATIVQKAIN